MAKKAATRAPFRAAKSTDKSGASFRSFHWPDRNGLGFFFSRYWWEKDAMRQGISDLVTKKMYPGHHPEFGRAAKTEVLLSSNAPADYSDIDFLLRRCDETLPSFAIHAMVQVKILLSEDEPWHVGYERVRSYARKHFACEFAVILIAHIPALAGLTGTGSHVHCIVLPRPISINGFGGACTELCSDRGYDAARAAWESHLASEGVLR